METQEVIQPEHEYEPTLEQAERAAALRRFNRLYIYVPIGLVSTITAVVVILLLIIAVNPPSAEALLFISGLADAALVIAMLPFVLLGAAGIALMAYAYSGARKRGTAPVRQTQRLLWRMDNLVGRVRVQTKRTANEIGRPFIRVNELVTYIRVLMLQLVKLVKRS